MMRKTSMQPVSCKRIRIDPRRVCGLNFGVKASSMYLASLGCGLLFAIAPATHAAILANYTFDDASTTVSTNVSSDTDTNSVASNFTINNGGTAGGGAAISASTDMAFFRSDGLTTTQAGAVGAPDYFTFTFTPNAGTSFNLTSITLDLGGSNGGPTGGPAGGPSNAYSVFAFLRSSAEAVDYSTNIGSTATQLIPGPGDGAVYNLSQRTFDLTGSPEFANITTATTFRIYLYSSDNTFANQILRVDNVVLNGTLIPEPGSMTLALVSLGAGLCFRRRSR